MSNRWIRLGTAGRLVIPADVRAELGFNEGDHLLVRVVDGALPITSRATAVAGAQRLVAERLHLRGRSVSQELIDERRAEVAREERPSHHAA